MLRDLVSALAVFATVVGLVVGGFWITGQFDGTPAQRAGFPDPPPTCERGELPRRIYLSRGDIVMTCRLPETPR